MGIWRTVWILAVTTVMGMALAIPLGLAQAVGPWYLATPARVFCAVIRGTPLLLQLVAAVLRAWVAVSAVSLDSRQQSLADPAAGLALCGAGADAVSFAGYEGEVMRGAFKGVPRASWRPHAPWACRG